jgi:hypothetical protein
MLMLCRVRLCIRNRARLIESVLKKAGFGAIYKRYMAQVDLCGGIYVCKGRIQKGKEVVFYFTGHGV